MAELKTKATKESVTRFLNSIEPKEKRSDSFVLVGLFQKITGEKPVMWGSSIVGFGTYHYQSERSTQKGDWPLAAFSPRKQSLTLYVMEGNKDSQELFKKLGKYKTSLACLYINKLSDVNQKVLITLIKKSFQYMQKVHK
ncbi:MAG: DUF1801 domain-containing protein [Patescibacteria group bacterium]